MNSLVIFFMLVVLYIKLSCVIPLNLQGTAAVFLYTNRHAGEVAPCLFSRPPMDKYSESNNKINHENLSDEDQASDVDYLLMEHALRYPCKKHPPPVKTFIYIYVLIYFLNNMLLWNI